MPARRRISGWKSSRPALPGRTASRANAASTPFWPRSSPAGSMRCSLAPSPPRKIGGERDRRRLGDRTGLDWRSVAAEQAIEILDRFLESGLERHFWLPAQEALGTADIGAPLCRIVDRQWAALDLRARAGQVDDLIRKLGHGGLDRVADIDGAGDVVGRRHQADPALDEIVDIAEGARLAPIAVERDRIAPERLDDEIRHD